MSKEQELQNLGEDVRKEGKGDDMTELVFDPVRGEFTTQASGSELAPGEMNVTEMTKEGFAF